MKPALKFFSFAMVSCMVQLGIASRTISVLAENWCSKPFARMRAGDFDGNGLDDLVCYRDTARYQVAYDSRYLTSKLAGGKLACFGQAAENEYLTVVDGYCQGSGKHLNVGDFNADNISDLLCFDENDKTHTVALSISPGYFKEISMYKSGWCMNDKNRRYVGDFDGDLRSDLLCHERLTGKVYLTISNGSTGSASDTWSSVNNWCDVDSEDQKILVGDFNADGIDDILCRDSSGRTWIAYAVNILGKFKEFTVSFNETWSFCLSSGSELRVGYLNNDRLADLICRESSGLTSLAINNRIGNRAIIRNLVFCPEGEGRFFIGYFTDKSKQQFLCVKPREWQILSDFLE